MLCLGLLLCAGVPEAQAAEPILWDPWTTAAPALTSPGPDAPLGPATLFGLAAIRGYQILLSPLLGGRCQFEPSCSRYAFACIEHHGLIIGTWAGADRISRCHGSAGFGGYALLDDGRLADPPGR